MLLEILRLIKTSTLLQLILSIQANKVALKHLKIASQLSSTVTPEVWSW